MSEEKLVRGGSPLDIANAAIERKRQGDEMRQKEGRDALLLRGQIAGELGIRLDSMENWQKVEDEIIYRESVKKQAEIRQKEGWYGEEKPVMNGKQRLALMAEISKKAGLDLSKHSDFCEAETLALGCARIAFSLKKQHGIRFSRIHTTWFDLASAGGFNIAELQKRFPNWDEIDFLNWLQAVSLD